MDRRLEKMVLNFLALLSMVLKFDLEIKRYPNTIIRHIAKRKSLQIWEGLHQKETEQAVKNLHSRYSIKGSSYYRKAQGKNISNSYSEQNFLDYVHSARCKMGDTFVDTITPRHVQRIRKAISAKKHSFYGDSFVFNTTFIAWKKMV